MSLSNSNKRTLALYDYERQICRRKIIILCAHLISLQPKIENRWYVRPLFKEREAYGHYQCLTSEYQLSNSALYYNFLRMSSTCLESLLSLVGPLIQRSPTRPDILSAGEILTATIRYLATGDSMTDISYSFRISQPTVSKMLFQCCSVIWEVLNQKVMIKPNCANWKSIANDFSRKWNIPNCCGAIDGKHIIHQAFANSGSTNYNYKGSHSVILLAMCDASYSFFLVDIGAPGRASDGGVFRQSLWGKQIIENTIEFPEPAHIDNENGLIPHFIVADEAFPLLCNVMRPYPGRSKGNLPIDQTIFNYRLSRARRCIENTFGILVSKLRIFRSPIIASKPTVLVITQACVVLHNFIKQFEKTSDLNQYCPQSLPDRFENGSFIEGQWRHGHTSGGLAPITQMGSNFYSAQAKETRKKLTKYFCGPGAVPFQYDRYY